MSDERERALAAWWDDPAPPGGFSYSADKDSFRAGFGAGQANEREKACKVIGEYAGRVEQLERMARWLSGSCNSVDTDEIGDVMLRVLDGEEWSPGMLNFEDEESDNG